MPIKKKQFSKGQKKDFLPFSRTINYILVIAMTTAAIIFVLLTPWRSSTEPDTYNFIWQGTSLTIHTTLPTAPETANLYLIVPDPTATAESARAFAKHFGLEGDLYGDPSQYLIVDGKQWIYFNSVNDFTFYTDINGPYLGGNNLSNQQSRTAIDNFLRVYGFELDYQVEKNPQSFGLYEATPLLDEVKLHSNSYRPGRLEFLLDQDADIIRFSGSLLNPFKVDTVKIRTAHEALQLLMHGMQTGVRENITNLDPYGQLIWLHEYPDKKVVTLHGRVRTYPSVEPGGTPLIMIGSTTVSGAIEGLGKIASSNLIQATGQFQQDNGMRKFIITSWELSDAVETGMSGRITNEAGVYTFIAEDGTSHIMPDFPRDLSNFPSPPEGNYAVDWIVADGDYVWTALSYAYSTDPDILPNTAANFHDLNLSGVEIPLPPTPTLNPSNILRMPIDPGAFEGTQGLMTVIIYGRSDGSERIEYGLLTQDPEYPYVIMEGEGLQALDIQNHRPVSVWASPDRMRNDGTLVVRVNRIEIPYPDLQIQIMKGEQRRTRISGEDGILFTSVNGDDFVQLEYDCTRKMDPSILETGESRKVLIESLAIPGDSIDGYQTLCTFNTLPAFDPVTGKPAELRLTANLPYRVEDTYTETSARIEKVELVYTVQDSQAFSNIPNTPLYIQPAWRFHGHYSNGAEYEILVQALPDEYLKP